MLVKPELIEKIVAGTKVQTRRLVKEGEKLWSKPVPSDKKVMNKFLDAWNPTKGIFEMETINIAENGELPDLKIPTYKRIEYVSKEIKLHPEDGVESEVKEIIKWHVGKDYAVQPKQGAKGLSRCVFCDSVADEEKDWLIGRFFDHEHKWIPLRIRITFIRKERLGEITNQDATKEGFFDKIAFWKYFFELTGKRVKNDNPFVWVLNFEVIK